MGLGDISGIFSRFFVVGFYLPSFFALVGLNLVFKTSLEKSQILVIGGEALLAGLLLFGLRDVIWFKFSGYWPPQKRHMIGQPNRKPRERPEKGTRGRAMLRWNDFWARTEDYRSFVRDQWGLDTWIAWPFIEASLTDREREIHNDASANVHFFQNASLGALAVAVGLVVAAIDDPVLGGWVGSALVAVGCGALAYWFYRGAVAAVELWGQAKIVSVITHRYELYAHLGYREPTSPAEEREIGRGANEILYGENKKGPEEHVRLDRTPRSTPGAPFGSH